MVLLSSWVRRRSYGNRWPLALAMGLCGAIATLVWFGYQATHESRRSARLLLERRAAEQLALLWAGLTLDMKGAHATVLAPVTPGQLVLEPPYDLADTFAQGFARFPYPESFFAWKDPVDEETQTYVFNRSDRPPSWHRQDHLSGPYPVEVLRAPDTVMPVVAQARQQARFNAPFAVFETDIGGTPYQVVVKLLYRSDDPSRLFGLVGMTVNLDWVREFYFQELIGQIARIGGTPDEVSLEILDNSNQIVASTRSRTLELSSSERSMPLVFVDRVLLGTLPRGDLVFRAWTARASAASESELAAVAVGHDITFTLIAIAAAAGVVGLVLAMRGVRMTAELAVMKSDFVSSVTHELKTPLAAIRLIADTLARGRYDSSVTIRDYAVLLSKESRDLTRLIDNLLAYARLSDVKQAYVFEALEVTEVVDHVLEHFRELLFDQQYTVDVEVSPDLPPVWADRAALIVVVSNLIDNAMKHSNGSTRLLRVHARSTDGGVTIGVADDGVGIRKDEIERVCDKFFRGRDSTVSGSGLGLAIVQQVVEAHGGRVHIESETGRGTRVEFLLRPAVLS